MIEKSGSQTDGEDSMKNSMDIEVKLWDLKTI